MRLLKQGMAVLATVVVIAVIAALVTPKTAHALVATAVQVINNVAVLNPLDGNGNAIPLSTKDVDSPVHSPFDTEGVCDFNAFPDFPGECYVHPILFVPAGQVAVVQYASVFCQASGAVPTQVDFVNGTSVDHWLTLPGGVFPFFQALGQNVNFYIPGTGDTNPFAAGNLNVIIQSPTSGVSGRCFAAVSGYMAPR